MKIKKILIFSFLLFIFLLPWQTVYFLRESFIAGEKWQYGTIGIYGTDILLLCIILLALALYKKGDVRGMMSEQGKIPLLEAVLFSLLILAGLSILWAGDRWLAVSASSVFFLAVGVFFFARAVPKEYTKKIIFILLFSGIVESGIGIAQFVYQKSIDLAILGMSSHTAYEAGSSVLKIDSGRFLRAYGTFSHPNILGLYLGVILILGVAYYIFLSTFEKTLKKALERLILLVSIVIIFLGLMLTFSRSAWLGVFLGIVAVSIAVLLQKESGILIRFSKILFVLLLSGFVFGSLLSEQIFPRFDTVTIQREGSITERVQSLRDAGTIIGEGNMFLGIGIGNFTVQMRILQPGRPIWNIQPAHNVFVLIFAELGIVGLVLFLSFLFFVMIRIVTSLKDINHKAPLFVFALISIIPSLFLDHFLWSSHFGLFFLFLLLGLASRR